MILDIIEVLTEIKTICTDNLKLLLFETFLSIFIVTVS